MTRRGFKSELEALVFILSTNPYIMRNPRARSVLDDFEKALSCYRVKKMRKYLIWGLLIGRSLDTFTVFFLASKRFRPISSFGHRIGEICDPNSHLTSDPAIQADLIRIKNRRNDLFHEAGRHFSDVEMEDFVFTTTKCITQLLSDLP